MNILYSMVNSLNHVGNIKMFSESIDQIKKSGVKCWFTSDLHFGHKNVIEFCKRPTTVEEQTDWIITQINSVVGEDDIVYHLGDFTFAGTSKIEEYTDILNQLNGTWRFIMGNHDNIKLLTEICNKADKKHVVVGHYTELKYNKSKFVLCHFPFKSWNCSSNGSYNIHGHCHGELTKRHFSNKYVEKIAEVFGWDKRKQPVNQIDVGIDSVEGWIPIEIDQVVEFLAKSNPKRKVVNHHSRKAD